MSNAVFPSLPGLRIVLPRAAVFNTRIQTSVSGAEARASFQAYPLRRFTLGFEFLRHGADNELRQLEGFFLARKGAYDSFLFADPADAGVTDQVLGVGTGSQTQFQVQRTFGAGGDSLFTEPVHNVATIGNVKIAGVATAAYSLGATGMITTTNPVPAGQVITWTGSYYYRCRFLRDEADFDRFLDDLYEAKKIELLGSLQNKV